MLDDILGIRCVSRSGQQADNYGSFPILLDDEYPLTSDGHYEKLRGQNIHDRRYFYPLISDFPMHRGLPSAQRSNLSVAADVADRVICLPIFPHPSEGDIARIVDLIRAA